MLQMHCQSLTGGKSLKGKFPGPRASSRNVKTRGRCHCLETCYDLQCTISPCVKTAVAKTSSPGCEALLNDHIDLAHLAYLIDCLCLDPYCSTFSLMTGSSESSPSSPNTKPEPLQGQCCSCPNSGLSGPSCASVPPTMPDSRQRSPNYMVKLCKIQIQEISTPSTAFFSYFL